MDAASSQLMNQYVYDGRLSKSDTDIERRPYRRNCGCAFHKSKGSHTIYFQHGNVTFPKNQSWNDCSVSITSSKNPFAILHFVNCQVGV